MGDDNLLQRERETGSINKYYFRSQGSLLKIISIEHYSETGHIGAFSCPL